MYYKTLTIYTSFKDFNLQVPDDSVPRGEYNCH